MRKTKGNFKKTEEKGITLIALVITIIILIILAAVSIRAITGDSSLIGEAQSAKLETAKSSVIDDARLAYSAIYVERTSRGDGSEVKLSEVVKLMQEENADYKKSITSVSQDSVSSIQANETSIRIKEGETKEITITTTAGENENTAYYIKIQGKYYPINMNNGNIKLGEGINSTDNGMKLLANSESEGIATAEASETTVTVKGENKGQSKITVSCGGASTEIAVTVIPNYGKTVDLGIVTVNGTALKHGWKYFYKDDNNIHLVYETNLEQNQIPRTDNYFNINEEDNTLSFNIENVFDCMNVLRSSRATCMAWADLENAIKSALSSKGITENEVSMDGSIFLPLLANSYSDLFPEKKMYWAYWAPGYTYHCVESPASQGDVLSWDNENWYFTFTADAGEYADLYCPSGISTWFAGKGCTSANALKYITRSDGNVISIGEIDKSGYEGVRPTIIIKNTEENQQILGIK